MALYINGVNQAVNQFGVPVENSGGSTLASNVDFSGLPTSDPAVASQIWNDGGILKISAGATPTTLNLNVSVNADDGYVSKTVYNNTNSGSYDALATTGGSTLYMGGFYNDFELEYTFYTSFFRFRNLSVAQGQTIDSASIKFTKSGGTGSTSQDLTIAALDSATGIGTGGIGGVAMAHTNFTTATVAFPSLMGSSNDEKTSPDIKTIVQEIVDRSDWSSGDSITLVCFASSIPTNTTARIQARSKEHSSGSQVAELSVTYTS
jgi:hypothetical protein